MTKQPYRPSATALILRAPSRGRFVFSLLALGVALGMATSACTGGAGGSRHCQVWTTAEPQLSVLQAPPERTSQLTLGLDVSEQWLAKRLDEEVPRTLATENGREIGAPGRASFTVTRKGPKLSADHDQLSVAVPIHLDISVCKPIGSACLRYGSCQPDFAAHFDVQGLLSDDYKLASPRARLSTTKRCVIGIDVTPEIEKIAQRELRSVEKQMKKRWPNTRALVSSYVHHLQTPLTIWSERCALLKQPSLSQTSLRVAEVELGKKKQRRLQGAWQLKGTIENSDVCSGAAADATAAQLPPLSTESTLPALSRIYLPETLTKQGLLDALRKTLTENPLPDHKLSLAELRLGQEGVALAIDVEGSICGRLWFLGKPAARSNGTQPNAPEDSKTGALRYLGFSELHAVQPQPQKKKDAASNSLDSLTRYLQDTLLVPLAGASWLAEGKHEQLLDQALASLHKEVEGVGLKLQIADLTVGEMQSWTDGEALHLYYPLDAAVSVRD